MCFKEEFGLPWSEISRPVGTYPHTMWRWKADEARPNTEHMMAPLEVSEDLGLGDLFTD